MENKNTAMEAIYNSTRPQTDNDVLAMAFVNVQPFGRVYDPAEAFVRGTLYPDLDKPFLMGGGKG